VRWAIVRCLVAGVAIFGLSRVAAVFFDRVMGVFVLVIFGPVYCFLALAIVTLIVVYLYKRVREPRSQERGGVERSVEYEDQ